MVIARVLLLFLSIIVKIFHVLSLIGFLPFFAVDFEQCHVIGTIF